jgi:hypothetical protein
MTSAFVSADQFIQTKVTEWKNWDFQDKDRWEQFQDDFEGWTETTFKEATLDVLRALRAYLRERGVWVMKHERKTIAKSLHDVLQKETETFWIEEEILRCMSTENFISYRIELLLETEFGRRPKDYLWQAKRRSSRRESSSRGSSVQKKPLSRFSKFFQSSEFSSVFNRQLYSRLLSIPSYRRPPISSLISPRASHLSPQNQLEKQSDGQSGGQSDEQSDEQSLRQLTPSSPSSENQSIGRQSFSIIENSEHLPIIDNSEHVSTTENSEHPDESSDGLSVESLDEPQVGSSNEPLVESSDGFSVNQSIKHLQPENQVSPPLATPQGPPIIDNSDHVLITEISEHPDKRPDGSSTPPTSVNQSIEQSKGQSSMRHSPRESSIARNFLRQSPSSSQSENPYIRQSSSENSYIRLSENSYTFIIHRRCGIE